MRTLGWTFLGLCALGVVACGGAVSGGGVPSDGGAPPLSTVTGHAGGQAVPTTDTVALIRTNTSTAPGGLTSKQTTLVVAITNIPDTCGILQHNRVPPNATALALSISAQATSVAAGTYPIVGPSSSIGANAAFSTTDAKCASKTSEQAASGAVTLTASSPTTVAGSFDVTMGNGDRLSGTFDAPVCNVDLATNPPVSACGS